MKILLGSRNSLTEVIAINVLSIIDKIDKKFEKHEDFGYRKLYDLLSEYAHPNWSGTHGLYADMDLDKILTNYGKNIRDDKINAIGYSSIQSSLHMAITSHKEITKMTDEFIKFCEEDIKNSPEF